MFSFQTPLHFCKWLTVFNRFYTIFYTNFNEICKKHTAFTGVLNEKYNRMGGLWTRNYADIFFDEKK